MHSDEMNKIEVRNVKKFRCLPFSMKFSFRWETTVAIFICCPNLIKIGHHM